MEADEWNLESSTNLPLFFLPSSGECLTLLFNQFNFQCAFPQTFFFVLLGRFFFAINLELLFHYINLSFFVCCILFTNILSLSFLLFNTVPLLKVTVQRCSFPFGLVTVSLRRPPWGLLCNSWANCPIVTQCSTFLCVQPCFPTLLNDTLLECFPTLLYLLQNRVLTTRFSFLLLLELSPKSGWSLRKIRWRWCLGSPCKSTSFIIPWVYFFKSTFIGLIPLISNFLLAGLVS